MIINVEQYDINEGHQLHCRQCPVARVLNRVLLNGYECTVTQASILVFTEHRCVFDCQTPLEALKFICAFDNSDVSNIKSFSFELLIPEYFVKREWWLKSKKELTDQEMCELADILYYKQDL